MPNQADLEHKLGNRGSVTRNKRQRGQGLVEFAVVFPVFMLMLGGAIQFGIIFWGQNTLNQIVRDAGRYAVTMSDCSAGPGLVSDAITNSANGFAKSFAGTLGTVSVVMPTVNPPTTPSGAPCPPTSNQQQVWVHIRVDGTVPIFFPLVPGNGAISSEATFRMEPVNP
jgi:Flp pilus assembly protein TadG